MAYYFDANLAGERDFFRGIPIYAVHVGQDVSGGWSSNTVSGFGGFQHMMWTVNVQVPVYVAMPRFYANQYFTKGKEYKKLAIYAFKPMPGQSWQSDGGYMVGATIALVIKDLKVVNANPILQWKGLPPPVQVQKNYLEKKLGREAYIPMAVQLFVTGDCDTVE
jgi:hypothetical protein